MKGKENMKTSIEIAIEAILRKGTRIASFTYDGERRNVLIGASEIANQGPWGVQENRAIRRHNGKTFLVARVHNEGGVRLPSGGVLRIKAFDLAKIQSPSYVLA
jgi:hypothetical protein